MGKPTGFMEYDRADTFVRDPASRIRDYEEFHRGLVEKERRRQSGRCMDCGVPFCQAGAVFEGRRLGCPLHNLIPEWNDMVWRGNREFALTRLLKTSPFPEFTGRVCPALCEKACTLNLVGKPVTVRENELYIIEYAFENGMMEPKQPLSRSGRAVAVVGSGPAGLSAAYYLNRRGHSVTVFERDEEPGGLLMYGIPNMKLPKDVVRRRIKLMEAEGVRFQTGVDISDFGALAKEFDCVIACCGAQKPRPLAYEGTAQSGVYFGLDYLKAAARERINQNSQNPVSAQGKTVCIVGAGDSASDCLATALRQGCKDAFQLIRKPASYYQDGEDYAHQESRAVFGKDVRCFEARVKAVSANEGGELCGVTVTSPQGEQAMEADMLIIASGFSGSEDYVQKALSDCEKQDNVFTAGDMASGASLVVLAIAGGKKAAAQADEYMMGYTNIC